MIPTFYLEIEPKSKKQVFTGLSSLPSTVYETIYSPLGLGPGPYSTSPTQHIAVQHNSISGLIGNFIFLKNYVYS